jgi:Spy/CpxP family protein refolding chaperone
MSTENIMASAIITSAKHGAYVAIGLYLVMVLVVSFSPQSQQSFEAPIQVAHPGIQFEHRAQQAMVDQADLAGVGGA